MSEAFDLVVVIPVYNHPETIGRVVASALSQGLPCLLVDDGSEPVCAQVLADLAQAHRTVSLVRLSQNQGKGGAMMVGLRQAYAQGYSHALQIDADGQHNTEEMTAFKQQAMQYPAAVICGCPVYDESVPRLRFYARYLTHVAVWINCRSRAIADSMCGFRVYPLRAVMAVLEGAALGQRMDFDPEVLVRLYWQGVPIRNQPTRVVYPENGRSHYRFWRDTALLARLHGRLFVAMVARSWFKN